MAKNSQERMTHVPASEQPIETPSRKGRLATEPMLTDASHIEELRAETQSMDEWQTAQMKRRIEGITPEKHAVQAMDAAHRSFGTALKKGSLTSRDLERTSSDLQAAWNDLQEEQTELRTSTDPDAERKIAENWELIKGVNQLMEITADEDPAAALEHYETFQMRQSSAVRRATGETRTNELSGQLEIASRRVQNLERQIKETFGVDADMLLSGAKPTQNRLRYVFGAVIGGDTLIKQLRDAQHEEDTLSEESSKLRTSGREKMEFKGVEKKYIKSKKQLRSDVTRDALSTILPVETVSEQESADIRKTAQAMTADSAEAQRREQREDARAYQKEHGMKSSTRGAEMEMDFLGDVDEQAKRESAEAFVADRKTRRSKRESALASASERVTQGNEIEQGIRERLTAELGVNLARPLTDRVDGIMGSNVETQMKKYGFTPGDYFAAFSSYTEAVRDLASMEKAPRDSVYKGAERRVARLRKEIDGYAAKLDIDNEVFLGSHRMAENEAVPLTKTKKMSVLPRYELSTDDEEVTQRHDTRPAQEGPTVEARELEGSEAEIVRNIERRAGKIDISIDRARNILSQESAYALWELANAEIENDPSLVRKINGLEKGSENPATKFVYVFARYVDAKNVNADMPAQTILRDHAIELAKALGLENNRYIKEALKEEKRTAQKEAVKSARERQARSATKKRSFTNPGA